MTAAPSDIASAYSALQSAEADLQNRINVSQGNLQTISDAVTLLQGIFASATGATKSSANVLSAKGDSLSKIQTQAVADAGSVLAAAQNIDATMQSPTYQFLGSDSTNWGSAMQSLADQLLAAVSQVSAQVSASIARVSQENADVVQFQKEVMQLQGAASGSGVLPTIENWVGGTVVALTSGLSGLIWPIAIVAAIAAVAYVASPGLLGMGKKRTD